MKRDMELIRLILLDTETGDPKIVDPRFAAYDQQLIADHVGLAKEGGLLDAAIAMDHTGSRVAAFHITGLTWQGHEFLDAARNEGIWNKAKDILIKKGVPMSFDVMKALLIVEGKKHWGLP